MNQGYVITDRVHVDPKNAFVLGVNPKAPQPYVTWKCGPKDDYYHGHYFNDRNKAISDLCVRILEVLNYKKAMEPVIGADCTCSNDEMSEQCFSTLGENGQFKKSKHKGFER